MQANVSLPQLFSSRKFTSALFVVLFWVILASTAFHAAAQDELNPPTPEPTPHTSIWIEPPVVTPAPTPVPPIGLYPRPGAYAGGNHMKINGWQRIGIIVSVIWMIVAWLYTFDRVSRADILMNTEIEELCNGANPTEPREKLRADESTNRA